MRDYVEFTGCAFYAFILLSILVSRDKTFRTPFWIFFVSGGVYGIFSVLAYNIKWSWDMPSAVFERATSTIYALGHTIAKLYVALSRYFVMRSHNLSENDWRGSLIVAMMVAQIVIPTIACTPLAFAQPTGVGREYGPPYLLKIVQAISACFYGSYVISGFILTLLAMRKLRALLNTASLSKDHRKLSSARQQLLYTIYSACLFLSHSLKCVQQILFVIANRDSDFYSVLYILYPFINDFAVFSSPIVMLIMSSKLRRCIFSIFSLTNQSTPTIYTTAT
ncbi:hypothetical protein PENTCL1PPCAC_20855, partial [Pristionchus entomophagus]